MFRFGLCCFRGAGLDVLVEMAERLEFVRKNEGLSQEAFSQRLGISRGAYQHYIRGGREIPSSVMASLLREFDIDPYWMLRGDDRGASSRTEEILVENATKIVLALLDAYKEQNIAWTEEKVINATQFAAFYLFNKRLPIEGHKEKLRKLAAS